LTHHLDRRFRVKRQLPVADLFECASGPTERERNSKN
jgi:hypothetical protein